jgi:hypothetical protein
MIPDRTDIYAMCPACPLYILEDGEVHGECCSPGQSLCPLMYQGSVERARVYPFRVSTGEVIIVDFEDKPKVIGYNWRIDKSGHVTAIIDGKTVKLHRLVTNTDDPSTIIDHGNRDKRDNRKTNLRQATNQQNAANRSKAADTSSRYIGVYWATREGKWACSIQTKVSTGRRKNQHLGYYATEREAGLAYNRAATALYGTFANLNVIEEDGDDGAKPRGSNEAEEAKIEGSSVDLRE